MSHNHGEGRGRSAQNPTVTFTSFDRLLSSKFKTVANRIDSLELTIKKLVDGSHRHKCCDEVLQKLNAIEELLLPLSHTDNNLSSPNLGLAQMLQPAVTTPVVLVNNSKPSQITTSLGLDSTVQVITLNSEKDFPKGTWLGDETNVDTRVRCHISPVDLHHVNTTCLTAERMAIKLLDCLFPPEVLAKSNLSGKGKHLKQQLNPLMIYGIRCHLMHRFNITEGQWFRIKQNIDSKCRTAWRKMEFGLSLYGSGKRRKMAAEHHSSEFEDNSLTVPLVQYAEEGESNFVTGPFLGENSDTELESQMELIHNNKSGDVKILHTTPEQLLRLQQRHHFRLCNNDQMLPFNVLEGSHILCEDDSVIDDGGQMLAIVTSQDDESRDMEGGEEEYVDVNTIENVEDLHLIENDVDEEGMEAALLIG